MILTIFRIGDFWICCAGYSMYSINDFHVYGVLFFRCFDCTLAFMMLSFYSEAPHGTR